MPRKLKSIQQKIDQLRLETEQANAQAAAANALAAIVGLASSGAYLNSEQAARYCGLKRTTLEIFRSKSTGPRCDHKASSRPRYLKKDLDEWMALGHGKQRAS
jgi:hypothetical protein